MHTISNEEHKMINECRGMIRSGSYDYEKLANMFADTFLKTFIPERILPHKIPAEVRRFWEYKKTAAWESANERSRENQLTDMWKKNEQFYVDKHQVEIKNKIMFDQIIFMLVDLKDNVRIDKVMVKLREIAGVIRAIPNPTVFVNMSILN